MAYKMDYFRGTEAQVLANLGNKIKYPAFAIVKDVEASDTCRLAFVNQNNELEYIRGLDENEVETDVEKQIVNVSELPDVSEGKTDMLYIVEEKVYLFNGTEYKCINEMDMSELKALGDRVDTLETSSADIILQVSGLETELSSMSDQIATLEEKVNAIKIPEECKCTPDNKYEITDVPAGTIVNYRDGEIRIMCPIDTVFTKQAVGTGGDANCYYATFKTYVPNDDVTGYIEHLGNKVDEEILTTFSTDKDGRRYQATWLALAKYDEATDSWTYYGANSSKEKYIGWDYRIDWYNSDGVMIASDCVRINLSNEECHFVIEPYYMASVKAEVEALKESNADVVEKLATVTEQVTEIEERVEIVEKESYTFIELE